MTLLPPTNSDTWIGLDDQTLPVSEALEWVNQPECGAVVFFAGNVRNHAEGRTNVTDITYESYEEQALPRLEKIAEKTGRKIVDDHIPPPLPMLQGLDERFNV